jgi:hypothetical protein
MSSRERAVHAIIRARSREGHVPVWLDAQTGRWIRSLAMPLATGGRGHTSTPVTASAAAPCGPCARIAPPGPSVSEQPMHIRARQNPPVIQPALLTPITVRSYSRASSVKNHARVDRIGGRRGRGRRRWPRRTARGRHAPMRARTWPMASELPKSSAQVASPTVPRSVSTTRAGRPPRTGPGRCPARRSCGGAAGRGTAVTQKPRTELRRSRRDSVSGGSSPRPEHPVQ